MLFLRLPQFQLARVSGIPLMIDYSWLPMAVLHLWMVSQVWLARGLGGWLPLWSCYAIGLVVTALFFASILVHELAHALVARFEGVEIYDIQLHIFGGWARLVGEPRTALAELHIALAGPAASLLLALFCWLGMTLAEWGTSLSSAVIASSCKYLLAANLVLALFNLLPGLPLDGGRALRAWLWHRRKDAVSATRTATQIGVAIAWLLIAYSVLLVGYGAYRGTFWQDVLAAIWLVIVGVFLMNSAQQDYRARIEQQAEDVSTMRSRSAPSLAGTVGAVMRTPAVSISPELKVSEFVDRILAKHRQTSFPVASEGRLYGVLSLERLKALPQPAWEKTAIREVMEPVDESHFIPARASLAYAVRKLKASPTQQLAVLDNDGLLVGSLTKAELDASA